MNAVLSDGSIITPINNFLPFIIQVQKILCWIWLTKICGFEKVWTKMGVSDKFIEHVKLVGHLILLFFVQADKLGAEIFFLEIIWE